MNKKVCLVFHLVLGRDRASIFCSNAHWFKYFKKVFHNYLQNHQTLVTLSQEKPLIFKNFCKYSMPKHTNTKQIWKNLRVEREFSPEAKK